MQRANDNYKYEARMLRTAKKNKTVRENLRMDFYHQEVSFDFSAEEFC